VIRTAQAETFRQPVGGMGDHAIGKTVRPSRPRRVMIASLRQPRKGCQGQHAREVLLRRRSWLPFVMLGLCPAPWHNGSPTGPVLVGRQTARRTEATRAASKSMEAEIIAIGDELTSGQLLDTNSQWLSQRHEELGIPVCFHTTVGDQLDAIVEVLKIAIRRADVLVTTGGLGPTADDLTREAIAEATGRPLRLDAQAMAHVRGIFRRRGRPMPKQNERQAMLPAGSRMIANPEGTAPGVFLELPRPERPPCRLFALPGVPAEMRQMWVESVAGILRQARRGARVVQHRRIKCFGAGESQIEAMLPDLVRRGRHPRVGINASQTTIILRVTATGATEAECREVAAPTVATIYECLGDLIFGEEDDELEHAVSRLLRERGQSVATCEWGTGGMVAHWLRQAGCPAEHFPGGMVVASQTALVRAVGVDGRFARDHPPCSGAMARVMAESCRRQLATDYGLAVSAAPEPSAQAAGPPSVFLALAGPEGLREKAVPYTGHPATLTIYCAKHALNLLRLALLGKKAAGR